MNLIIRDDTNEDINNGLLDVFIEGYRFHQKGRNDIFMNVSDDVLKSDLINNFDILSTIVIIDDNYLVFETDHFSTYIIGGNKKTNIEDSESIIEETKPNIENPKTRDEIMILIAISIISFGGIVASLSYRKKYEM